VDVGKRKKERVYLQALSIVGKGWLFSGTLQCWEVEASSVFILV
jgi:hypothetical protein